MPSLTPRCYGQPPSFHSSYPLLPYSSPVSFFFLSCLSAPLSFQHHEGRGIGEFLVVWFTIESLVPVTGNMISHRFLESIIKGDFKEYVLLCCLDPYFDKPNLKENGLFLGQSPEAPNSVLKSQRNSPEQ